MKEFNHWGKRSKGKVAKRIQKRSGKGKIEEQVKRKYMRRDEERNGEGKIECQRQRENGRIVVKIKQKSSGEEKVEE